MMMFDFCIPEAQRLADLTGASLDLDSALNHFDDVRVHLQVNEGADESSRISVGVQSQSVAGFRQAFMIPVRTLCQEVKQLVQIEVGLESAQITALARGMKIEEILLRKRDDGIAVGERQLTTTKVAQRFKSQ